jgi:hypothetical protein
MDENTEVGTDMDIVRSVGGSTMLAALPENYRGQGVRGEVMDTGFRSTHNDFQPASRFLIRSNSTNTSHGSSTTGIVFGSGSVNPQGTGNLPAAQAITAVYTSLAGNGGTTSRYASTQQLIAAPYRGMFQSNSWGSATITSYTSKSTEMDQIIHDMDILILNSQSNTGTQASRPEAWAKNIVSVGGISHFNTATLGDDQWTGASIGPAEDGRLKPDICHWYDNIFTTTNTSNTAYTTGFNGTSAATPICAGFFGLWFQLWADGVFGNSVLGADAFDAKPHFTLAKAWMINKATQYPFSGAAATNSRYKQGWGLAGIGTSYDDRDKVFYVNETDPLQLLQSKTYRIYVPNGTPELKVTMCYDDLPGTTSATQHRINDLTLKVTAPNGTFYYGNNGLTIGNISLSGGSPNTKDTVENVILPTPTPGVWTVQVSADAINQDARPETSEMDADFSLVASGVNMTALVNTSQVTYGSVDSGTIADLKTSNNRKLSLTNPTEFNDVQYDQIVQVVTGTAPFSTPTELRFRIESTTNQSFTDQKVEFYNYLTGQYEEVNFSSIPQADTVREIVVTSSPDRFVNGANREVKARITWRNEIFNDVFWLMDVDQERWFFMP